MRNCGTTSLYSSCGSKELPGVPQDGKEVRCAVSQRDGWQTLAMNPALHVEEMFTAADALMSLIPLVRRAGLEELHDWLETALLVMSAARRRLQTLF